jgi:hypothetical protein
VFSLKKIVNLGEYNEALQFLSEAGLDQLTEKPLPVRSLKIIAESFAVQALALEKIPVGTSFGKTPESKEQQLLKSMETAGDIALLYLQEQDKLQGGLKICCCGGFCCLSS